MLTPGEVVLNKHAVALAGLPTLNKLNELGLRYAELGRPGYAKGGAPSRAPALNKAGELTKPTEKLNARKSLTDSYDEMMGESPSSLDYSQVPYQTGAQAGAGMKAPENLGGLKRPGYADGGKIELSWKDKLGDLTGGVLGTNKNIVETKKRSMELQRGAELKNEPEAAPPTSQPTPTLAPAYEPRKGLGLYLDRTKQIDSQIDKAAGYADGGGVELNWRDKLGDMTGGVLGTNKNIVETKKRMIELQSGHASPPPEPTPAPAATPVRAPAPTPNRGFDAIRNRTNQIDEAVNRAVGGANGMYVTPTMQPIGTSQTSPVMPSYTSLPTPRISAGGVQPPRSFGLKMGGVVPGYAYGTDDPVSKAMDTNVPKAIDNIVAPRSSSIASQSTQSGLSTSPGWDANQSAKNAAILANTTQPEMTRGGQISPDFLNYYGVGPNSAYKISMGDTSYTGARGDAPRLEQNVTNPSGFASPQDGTVRGLIGNGLGVRSLIGDSAVQDFQNNDQSPYNPVTSPMSWQSYASKKRGSEPLLTTGYGLGRVVPGYANGGYQLYPQDAIPYDPKLEAQKSARGASNARVEPEELTTLEQLGKNLDTQRPLFNAMAARFGLSQSAPVAQPAAQPVAQPVAQSAATAPEPINYNPEFQREGNTLRFGLNRQNMIQSDANPAGIDRIEAGLRAGKYNLTPESAESQYYGNPAGGNSTFEGRKWGAQHNLPLTPESAQAYIAARATHPGTQPSLKDLAGIEAWKQATPEERPDIIRKLSGLQEPLYRNETRVKLPSDRSGEKWDEYPAIFENGQVTIPQTSMQTFAHKFMSDSGSQGWLDFPRAIAELNHHLRANNYETLPEDDVEFDPGTGRFMSKSNPGHEYLIKPIPKKPR
jgi:hypothetical protein